jgi:membrane associated rhomboid family serine protease
MIPLRDHIPSSRFPVVTVTLIALNVVAFLRELRLGPQQLQNYLLQAAIIPARYTDPRVCHLFSLPEQVAAFFTSIFLHGGWVHLLGNMIQLYGTTLRG